MEQEYEPLVSIVLPVFNGQEYIRKTVEKVQQQSYKNIEIIIIDDGSADSTYEIISDIAKDDIRVKIQRQTNSGVSAARNNGIKISNGKYICFIDADDYVGAKYIEYLLAPFLSHQDVYISAVKFRKVSKYDERIFSDINETIYLDRVNALNRCLLQQNGFDVSVSGKLYKRDSFVNLKFNDNLIYEDFDIIPRLFAKVEVKQKVAFMDCVQYQYVKTEDSIMTSAFRDKDFDILTVVKDGMQFVETNITACKDAYLAKAIAAVFGVYRKAVWSSASDEDLNILFQELKTLVHDIEWSKKVTKKEILVWFIVKLGKQYSLPLVKLVTYMLNQF